MSKISTMAPLCIMPGGRARGVSFAARANRLLFGSPNARRANGIVSTGFDLAGALSRLLSRVTGAARTAPVYAIDRIGYVAEERLPRIWLSEKVCNTAYDDGRRVFVECYPSSPDRGGALALELGDRYLGEGCNAGNGLDGPERKECFKAAEILYLHSARRGCRSAVDRLRFMYEEDLCGGEYWQTYLEVRARHAKRRAVPRRARLAA